MYISRGFTRAPDDAIGVAASPPASIDYLLMHDRVALLERLTFLRDRNTLSETEFAAEKQRILNLPSEELVLHPSRISHPRGPSLLGRIFNWKVLTLGALFGLGLGISAQPEQANRLWERIARPLAG